MGEMSCVGYWDEDWRSYMITWDPEDPTSAFRCWIYERLDWRHIFLSRSTNAACQPTMRSTSDDPKDGASLHLKLTENERQFDDCAQNYDHGEPWRDVSEVTKFDSGHSTSSNKLLVMCSIFVLSLSFLFT